MTPDEYRALQNRLNRVTAARSMAAFRSAPPATPAGWSRLSRLLFGVVAPQRSASHRLGLVYFSSLTDTRVPPRIAEPPYSEDVVRKAMRRFEEQEERIAERMREAADHGKPEPRLRTRDIAAMVSATAVRHGEQSGRETVIEAADVEDYKFARYDPRPPCCAFCVLLISRGPVYLSETSGGFEAHDLCTCVPVPVKVGATDWPGREQHEAAEKFYVKYAAGQTDQRAALRRAVRKFGSPLEQNSAVDSADTIPPTPALV